MSEDLYAEILAALDGLGIVEYTVKDSLEVHRRVKELFIVGNPRAWWERFRYKPTTMIYDNNTAYLHIADAAPCKDCDVWFIADDDEDIFVFDVNINDITNILSECRYFEYYIVPHDFAWIMAESDHGVLFLSKRDCADCS